MAIIGDKDANVEQAIAYANSSVTTAEKTEEPVKDSASSTKVPAAEVYATVPEVKVSASPVPVETPLAESSLPLAKRLAEERGIQLTQVQGSGDGGRIIKRDIEHFQSNGISVEHLRN